MNTGFLFLFSLLISHFSFACVCSEKADRTGAAEIADRSEIIVIGRAAETIGSPGSDGRSINVIFKVDSVIKGPEGLNQIVINQFSTGNCVKIFKQGEKYLIAGIRVKQFISGDQPPNPTADSHIPPPPPTTINNSVLTCFGYETTEMKYWNELAQNNLVISTNACQAFGAYGEMAKHFK